MFIAMRSRDGVRTLVPRSYFVHLFIPSAFCLNRQVILIGNWIFESMHTHWSHVLISLELRSSWGNLIFGGTCRHLSINLRATLLAITYEDIVVVVIGSTYKFAVRKGWLTGLPLSHQLAFFCWAWRPDPYGCRSTRAYLWHDCSTSKSMTEVCDTQQHIFNPCPTCEIVVRWSCSAGELQADIDSWTCLPSFYPSFLGWLRFFDEVRHTAFTAPHEEGRKSMWVCTVPIVRVPRDFIEMKCQAFYPLEMF